MYLNLKKKLFTPKLKIHFNYHDFLTSNYNKTKIKKEIKKHISFCWTESTQYYSFVPDRFCTILNASNILPRHPQHPWGPGLAHYTLWATVGVVWFQVWTEHFYVTIWFWGVQCLENGTGGGKCRDLQHRAL
jgi:hypothetical protein